MPEKTYIVKRGKYRMMFTKAELKKRNQEIAAEFKTADADRRGDLLQEYYELNAKFVSYFKGFFGEYLDELTNIFFLRIPEALCSYKPGKGTDVNSYLAMYAKLDAINEFLSNMRAVKGPDFARGPDGKYRIERPTMVHIDGLNHSNPTGGDGGAALGPSDPYYALSKLPGYDNFVRGKELEQAPQSYSRHFKGIDASIVRDFEGGMSWRECREKYKLTTWEFSTRAFCIRKTLERILKEEGSDVRYFGLADRWSRAAEAKRSPKRRAHSRLHRDGQTERVARSEVPEPDGQDGFDLGRDGEAKTASTFSLEEGLWDPNPEDN